jgi:hypothetical protein
MRAEDNFDPFRNLGRLWRLCLDVFTRTALAVAVLWLASCTTPTPAPSPVASGNSPMPRLHCPDSLGDVGPPSSDLEVFLDAAALPTQGELHPNDSGDGWLFAKMGLYVRPDVTVELSVDPAAQAAISYGRQDRLPTVVLQRCTDLPGRWIVYTGGYYVKTPMCLPVRVRVHGDEVQVRVPVGAGCIMS